MSGEGVVGVAVIGVVGSVWLAGKGLQVGALVAARSVELVGAGLVAVGDQAQRRRTVWEAEHAALLEWEAAARQVIDLNARIDVLRERGACGLPAPLQPCAESPAELHARCSAAQTAVDAAEQELRSAAAAAALVVLRHSMDTGQAVSAGEAFDRYHRALADQKLRAAGPPPDALAAVARIVARLAPDATDEDRADVLAAAAQVAARRADVGHDSLLDELRLRVQQAGERAQARQTDAIAAAVLLQAIPDGVIDDPELPGLRRDLGAVVAARRRLDPALRGRAERAAALVRAELERDYVRASVADTLAGLGYEVDEGFATVVGNPDRLRLRRPDWDGHAVQVVLDGDEVRAAVVRLEDRTGTDARREDVEREAQWCGDLVVLRDALDGAGLQVVERRLVPPGERIPPIVRQHPAAGAARAKERTRDRT